MHPLNERATTLENDCDMCGNIYFTNNYLVDIYIYTFQLLNYFDNLLVWL